MTLSDLPKLIKGSDDVMYERCRGLMTEPDKIYFLFDNFFKQFSVFKLSSFIMFQCRIRGFSDVLGGRWGNSGGGGGGHHSQWGEEGAKSVPLQFPPHPMQQDIH